MAHHAMDRIRKFKTKKGKKKEKREREREGKKKKKMRKKYNMHMDPKNKRIYLKGRVSGVCEN